MLLPLFLNNLLGAFRLVADAGVYEVAGTDVNIRIGYPVEIFKQGGAAPFVQMVARVHPDIVFGTSHPSVEFLDPEIVTPSATHRVRPTIVTMHRRRKPS